MTKANKIFLALAFYSFINSFSVKSQLKNDVDSSENSLHKGSWALIFEVGTFIDTKTFEGFQFGGKYHISNPSVLRLGFSYASNSNTGTINYNERGNPIKFPTDSKGNNLRASINILYFLNTSSDVVFFFGGGPTYSYSYSKENWSDYYQSPYSNEYFAKREERVSKDWSAGVQAILGAEWFIFKRISLIGEYNANITAGNSRMTISSYDLSSAYSERSQYNETSGDIFKLSFNLVKLGVSVYF